MTIFGDLATINIFDKKVLYIVKNKSIVTS